MSNRKMLLGISKAQEAIFQRRMMGDRRMRKGADPKRIRVLGQSHFFYSKMEESPFFLVE